MQKSIAAITSKRVLNSPNTILSAALSYNTAVTPHNKPFISSQTKGFINQNRSPQSWSVKTFSTYLLPYFPNTTPAQLQISQSHFPIVSNTVTTLSHLYRYFPFYGSFYLRILFISRMETKSSVYEACIPIPQKNYRTCL